MTVTILLALVSCTKQSFPPTKEWPGKIPESFRQGEYQRDRARLANYRDGRDIDVESYALKGSFDWDTYRLHASLDVELKVLSPTRTEIVLDSQVDKIRSVTSDGAPLPFTTEAGLLKIKLPVSPVTGHLSLTIEYEAMANVGSSGEEGTLLAVPARRGDPIPVRALATLSEPLGASEWMPCHNTPADRATFATDFTMPAGESLIANGDLLLDGTANGVHRMRYATRYSLPTYLMAFSVAEFTVTKGFHGNLPVSVWRRKGLPVDGDAVVKDLIHDIATYEKLLIPFPFEKYSLVLLPAYTGGIENAGITFQGETLSTRPRLAGDRWLSSHELAHQWFGDLVTIATWDDLWIKEGMAELLSEEAERAREDENRTGRLFGRNFEPASGEAIRDPQLPPEKKYTSGPYDRAAWLYTQMRSTLGEDKFWSLMRDLLRSHRFGVIGTAELLAYFHPALGDTHFEAVKRALSAKALPKLALSLADDAVTLELTDPDGALVVPLGLRQWHSNGTLWQNSLAAGGSEKLPSRDDALLFVDPADVHPWPVFDRDDDSFRKHLHPLLVPKTDAARERLLEAGGNLQLAALADSDGWNLAASDFARFRDHLSSEEAKFRALQMGCDLASREGLSHQEKAAWKAALTKALAPMDSFSFSRKEGGKALSYCRAVVGDELFRPVWDSLIASPATSPYLDARLPFVSLVSTDAGTALRAAEALVSNGDSTRTREDGLRLLLRHLKRDGAFEYPTDAELPRWKSLIRGVIERYDVNEIIAPALVGATVMGDKEALPSIAKGVLAARYPQLQKAEICAAVQITKNDEKAWNDFVKELGQIDKLPGWVRGFLFDRARCSKANENSMPL